jgi:hypothetical protein
MASVANINDVLGGHVALEIECVDRLYLNAYVPNLQVGGQVVRFLRDHPGHQIPSPALLGPIGNRFRRKVKAFAAEHGIPILQLNKPDRSRWDDRQLDHVRPYLERAEREGRFGVVAIVACQEFQWVFSARNRAGPGKVVSFEFFREERRVGIYYFYILDPEFGPGFIKIGTYAPYSAKVWLNGHEWAKRQAERAGIAFAALLNGFAACDQPERLQAICDSFGPHHVQAFFDHWITQIPTPLTATDQAAGYWWELSLRQVEISRTLVLDDPRRARAFFEALVQTTSGSAAPKRSRWCSPASCADRPATPTRPGSSPPAPSSGSTFATSTPASSSTSKTAARCGSRPSSTSRPISTSPPAQPPAAHRQSPPSQPATAYDRACRSELCHRLCAL